MVLIGSDTTDGQVPIPTDLRVEAYQQVIESIEHDENRRTNVPFLSIEVLPIYSKEHIRESQSSDPIIKHFLKYFEQNRKPSPSELKLESDRVIAMCRQFDRMTLLKGVLHRCVTDPYQRQLQQLVLPDTFKQQVLTLLHSQTGHQGIERTTNLNRERGYN